MDTERNHLTVTIVGDSQVNRLDGERLCNKKRKVEMKTKGGTKVKDIVKRIGTCNSNVIIFHAVTCEIKTKTPEDLRD